MSHPPQFPLTPQPPPPPPRAPSPAPPAAVSPTRREGPTELVPFAKDGGDRKPIPQALLDALVAWAARFGLDPYAGHTIYYFGQPYVTEKGALANAKRHPQYRGYTVSLLQPEDREKLGLGPEDVGWQCWVSVEGYEQPVWDYGVVTPQEQEQLRERVLRNLSFDSEFRQLPKEAQERQLLERLSYLPLYAHPGKMAKARAVRAAHLRAFPLGAGPKGEG